jgi:hypothetical protein
MAFHKNIFIVLLIVIILSLSIAIYFHNDSELKLGYCPTIYQEAKKLSEDNNYALVEYESSSEVLNSLGRNEVDLGLIGRRAESRELSLDVKEKAIKSGYTLVSNQKSFIEYSDLNFVDIYTYIPKERVSQYLLDNSKIIYSNDKQRILQMINEGKIVLIPWEDWNDDFELVVVMEGDKKSKEFRGAFLYN